MMNQSTTLQRLVDCGADIDVPDAHGRHTVMQSNTQSHYMHLHTQSHTSYTVTVAAWWWDRWTQYGWPWGAALGVYEIAINEGLGCWKSLKLKQFTTSRVATNNYNADPSGRTCSHYAATVPDSASLKVLFHQGVDLQVSCELSGYSSVLVLSILYFSTFPSPNPLNCNYSSQQIQIFSSGKVSFHQSSHYCQLDYISPYPFLKFHSLWTSQQFCVVITNIQTLENFFWNHLNSNFARHDAYV